MNSLSLLVEDILVKVWKVRVKFHKTYACDLLTLSVRTDTCIVAWLDRYPAFSITKCYYSMNLWQFVLNPPPVKSYQISAMPVLLVRDFWAQCCQLFSNNWNFNLRLGLHYFLVYVGCLTWSRRYELFGSRCNMLMVYTGVYVFYIIQHIKDMVIIGVT